MCTSCWATAVAEHWQACPLICAECATLSSVDSVVGDQLHATTHVLVHKWRAPHPLSKRNLEVCWLTLLCGQTSCGSSTAAMCRLVLMLVDGLRCCCWHQLHLLLALVHWPLSGAELLDPTWPQPSLPKSSRPCQAASRLGKGWHRMQHAVCGRSEVYGSSLYTLEQAVQCPPAQQLAVDTTSATGSRVKIFNIHSAGSDSSEGMTAPQEIS